METGFRKLEMNELGRLSVDEAINQTKNNFVFVLDGIRSLNNVGSIFRTADASASSGIYLCGFTGQPPHRDIQKTALGATETVFWQYFESIEKCLLALIDSGFKIVSVEQTANSVALDSFTFQKSEKYAFVLGNEVSGVSTEALSLSDMVLEIPQFGSKHSLNVAVSAGIVGWAFISKVI